MDSLGDDFKGMAGSGPHAEPGIRCPPGGDAADLSLLHLASSGCGAQCPGQASRELVVRGPASPVSEGHALPASCPCSSDAGQLTEALASPSQDKVLQVGTGGGRVLAGGHWGGRGPGRWASEACRWRRHEAVEGQELGQGCRGQKPARGRAEGGAARTPRGRLGAEASESLQPPTLHSRGPEDKEAGSGRRLHKLKGSEERGRQQASLRPQTPRCGASVHLTASPARRRL